MGIGFPKEEIGFPKEEIYDFPKKREEIGFPMGIGFPKEEIGFPMEIFDFHRF
jgi:hypothetical protein